MTPPTSVESDAPIQRKLTPALRAANSDGMAWACMVGAGETYLTVFGIFLRATALQLGLLATLPQFLGAISQLAGVWAMKFFPSRRQAVISFVWVNAFIWLGIATLPFSSGGSAAVYALIGLSSIYYISGSFVSPVWSSLIGDLVPAHIRGRYFGYRNGLVGLFTFLAILAAGQMLDLGRRFSHPELGFVAIFLLAFGARCVSIYYLRKYDDPAYTIEREHHFSFWQFIRRSPKSNFAKFVYFVSLINFGVNISTPFFAVYMLRDLQLSYIEFTLVTATNTVTQFLTMQHWGKLSDQFGNKKILNLCGYGVALSPIMWLFGEQLWYLLLIQVYAGFVWAGFNLAVANFLFDAVTPPKRARCVAYQAMVNGAFVLCGSLLGAYLTGHVPERISFAGMEWIPRSSLMFVFLFSGLVRLAASALLLPRFREVRPVEPIPHSQLIFRITHLSSLAGGATFSILPFVRRRKHSRIERGAQKRGQGEA